MFYVCGMNLNGSQFWVIYDFHRRVKPPFFFMNANGELAQRHFIEPAHDERFVTYAAALSAFYKHFPKRRLCRLKERSS